MTPQEYWQEFWMYVLAFLWLGFVLFTMAQGIKGVASL